MADAGRAGRADGADRDHGEATTAAAVPDAAASGGERPDDIDRHGPMMAAALLVVIVVLAAVAVRWGGSESAHPVSATTASAHAAVSGASGMAMSGGGSSSMPLADPPRWDDGALAFPSRHVGPQGGVGQFVAACRYSHSAEVDPIVFPGQVGASHHHDFYGATNTDEHSTPDSLRAGGTTCDKPGDDAAYWQPTLFDGDVEVVPREIHAYYRAAPGIDPTTVVPFPDGLMMLAGDPFADSSGSASTGAAATASGTDHHGGPHSGTDHDPPDRRGDPAADESAARVEAAGWTCGVRTDLLADPPACPATAPLVMLLSFPDCWDGEHVDVEGHRGHVTYSRGGECPERHPVPVPQLTVAITFPISGADHDLRLSSGSVRTAHGDFFNAWDPDALSEQVRLCIHRQLVCELASNRQEESLFQTR